MELLFLSKSHHTVVGYIIYRLYSYCVSGHYPSPRFYVKHNVSETEFCLRLQVEPTQLVPIDRSSLYLRTPTPTLTRNRTYKLSIA
jgi:hypothetical protein